MCIFSWKLKIEKVSHTSFSEESEIFLKYIFHSVKMRFCIQIFNFLLISVTLVSGDLSLNSTSDETDVKFCEKFQVCNLVHNPYFGNSEVEKFCNCPKETFCPTTFDRYDNKSIPVNGRSQMKFCTKVEEIFKELPECEKDQPSLIIRKMYEITKLINTTAELTCKCNKNYVYWNHIMRAGSPIIADEKLFMEIDHFECRELPECETNDFCGLARIDYGFIFQRCTCSQYDKCRFYVEDSEIEEQIEELFYNDLFYKSYCMRKENMNVW